MIESEISEKKKAKGQGPKDQGPRCPNERQGRARDSSDLLASPAELFTQWQLPAENHKRVPVKVPYSLQQIIKDVSTSSISGFAQELGIYDGNGIWCHLMTMTSQKSCNRPKCQMSLQCFNPAREE